jgi:hypothetical protein
MEDIQIEELTYRPVYVTNSFYKTGKIQKAVEVVSSARIVEESRHTTIRIKTQKKTPPGMPIKYHYRLKRIEKKHCHVKFSEAVYEAVSILNKKISRLNLQREQLNHMLMSSYFDDKEPQGIVDLT